MLNILRRTHGAWLVVLVGLCLALIAQPAAASWLSGSELQRIDNPDGSTTYFWTAQPMSQCQWEGQQVYLRTYMLRLQFELDHWYYSWSNLQVVQPPPPPAPEPVPQPAPPVQEPVTPPPAPVSPPTPPAPDPVPPPAPQPESEPQADPAPVPDAGVMNEWEAQLLELVNQERTARGLNPLTVDPQLVEIARLKSQDMADLGYFAHQSPTYGSPFEMMRSFGVTYRMAGENLAAAFSVESAHEALMNSPGHRANILNPGYTHIGIGIVQGGGYPRLVTQLFVGR